MIIQEDLNGVTWNRMPAGYTKTNCETYLLDMSIAKPTLNDLHRITASAPGGEITGAVMVDQRTMLINCQHPDAGNTYPYNNSLTYAISGFSDITTFSEQVNEYASDFSVFPNPASRELRFNEIQDVAVYDALGNRVKVERQVLQINVSDLAPGLYFIQNLKGNTVKFIVE